jgi:gluconolactonase
MRQLLLAGLIPFVCTIPALAQDMPLSQVLIEGEGWKLVDNRYELIHELEANIFFSGEVKVYHTKGEKSISAQGEVRYGPSARTDFRKYLFGPPPTRSIFTIDPAGGTIDIAPTISGWRKFRYLRIDGLKRPSGAALSSDAWTLFVGDAEGNYVWAFRIGENGDLSAGKPYCPLRTKVGDKSSGVTALASDTDGRIYAATPLGVQIFDPTGRLCGVMTKPADGPLVGVAFGGADGKSLYIASKTAVYVRKVRSQGLGFTKPK